MSVTMRQMLEAGVHCRPPDPFLEPQDGSLHLRRPQQDPHRQPRQTLAKLQRSHGLREEACFQPGNILFVGTKRQAREIMAEEAQRQRPFVEQRWLGGMLTNFKTVKTSIKRLKDMELAVKAGELEKMPKKEALTFRRELENCRSPSAASRT